MWRFRQLVALLVVRELKVRYKRSVLGLLWTMLNPLLLMLGIFLVLAWKVAGWYGLDRYLLPLVGTPWTWGKQPTPVAQPGTA